MSSQSLSASDTIMDLERGKSILLTFGKLGRLLKRKIAMTGFLCRIMCFLIFNPIFLIRATFSPNAWHRKKITAIRFFGRFFPYHIKGHQITPSSNGQIVVINHPTLNDPLCAILYILNLYPDREIIIPINLPWFESVCRYRSKLLKIGVNIAPILTPETAKRLGSNSHVLEVQNALVTSYTTNLMATLSRGGLVVIAQQATRQRYIFTNHAQSESGEGILATISLILASIRRNKLLEQTSFIPIGVIPHDIHAKPKLNLFHKYTLNVGEPILATDLVTVKNVAKRPADLHILLRLTQLLPSEFHFEKPPETD